MQVFWGFGSLGMKEWKCKMETVRMGYIETIIPKPYNVLCRDCCMHPFLHS